MATVNEYAKKIVNSDGAKTATELYDAEHGKWKDNVQRDETMKSSGGTKLDPSPISGGTATK